MTKVNAQSGNAKLDSLRIYIPEWLITKNNLGLGMTIMKVIQETGEILPGEYKEKCYTIEHKGISVRFNLTEGMKGKRFYMSLTAKMLEQDYFEGITKDNLHKAYNFLMSIPNGLQFTFEAILGAEVKDVDYCLDFEQTPEQIQTMIKRMSEPIRSKRGNFNHKKFTAKDNLGIQFQNRNQSSRNYPFLKIYHKTTEIEKRKAQQEEQYPEQEHFLKGKDIGQLTRIELTFGRAEHWTKARIKEPKTLAELLEIDNLKMENAIRNQVNDYTMTDIKPRKKSQGTYVQGLVKAMTELLKEMGHSPNQIKQITLARYKMWTGEDSQSKGYKRAKKALENAQLELFHENRHEKTGNELLQELMKQKPVIQVGPKRS
jgi:hypothetical protein